MNQHTFPLTTYIRFFFSVVILKLLLYSCQDNLATSYISSAAAPIAIEFLEADTQAFRNVELVKVTLIDPEGLVVTSTGKEFDTLLLSSGLISLALKKGSNPSSARPYRFHLKAEAEGYIPTVKTILIRNSAPKYYSVFMAQLNNPPPGMNVSQKTIELKSEGELEEELLLETSKENDAVGEMNITISPGTRFFSEGALVGQDSKANVELAYVNTLQPAAGRTFPGFLVTDAIGTQGEVIANPGEPLFLNVIGWYALDINFLDGTRVDSVSEGIRVEYEINPFLLNPLDSSNFRDGERLQMWRLNEKTGIWKLQEEITSDFRGGSSVASFKVDQLSTHAITISTEGTLCKDPIQLLISNPYPVAQQRFCELVSSADGTPYSFSLTDEGELLTFDADTVTEITITGAPIQDCVNFLMYDYEQEVIPGQLQGVEGGYEVFTTCLVESDDAPLPICGPTNVPPIQMTLLAPDDKKCVSFQFEIRFGENEVVPICNNALWYKQCNACTSDTPLECLEQPWKFAGILEFGALNSPKFDPAEQYCLRLWYVGSDPADPGTLIEQIIDFHINLEYEIFNDTGRQILPDPSAWLSTTNSKIEWQKSSADPCGHHYRILIDNEDGLLRDNAGNVIQEIQSCEPVDVP